MPDAAVQAHDLVKWFGEGAARTYAVRDVSFAANFGEMLYIVGPSGSGKTTLLSMISGILQPNAGVVLVKGINIWELSANQLADFRLHTVGFVFQDYHLFPKLTTLENVAMPLILKRQDWQEAMRVAMGFLDIVGLKERAALPPVRLSGGEQQRVAIARAIVSRPDILIFDEPTASLDGNTGRRILAFVKENILNEQLRITAAQVRAGTVPYANVLGVRAQLASTEATLPPLKQNLSQTEHLLAALAGHRAAQWRPPTVDLADFVLPVALPLTLPSELARRRPDILAAEAQLHSASANIGVATAAMFPSLTLSATYGQNSNMITNLLAGAGNFWSMGAGLAMPVLQGGTLWFQRRAAIAAYQASLFDYRQVVVSALQQVADTLRALEHDAETVRAQSAALATARQTLQLITASYTAGLVDYLQVLVADSQYQQARLGHIQATALRLQDTAALFLALGGGWWAGEGETSAGY